MPRKHRRRKSSRFSRRATPRIKPQKYTYEEAVAYAKEKGLKLTEIVRVKGGLRINVATRKGQCETLYVPPVEGE